ncbi:hypothetical protein FJTKL_12503 [Diaporthe vaccinii]|uniref:EXPERA domain-containing protein n=1 Tax=Diaporthe vaccinii TaxID=105482 RepID=A0ABR4EDP3_9PEZI
MLVNAAEGGRLPWWSLIEHAAWGIFNQSYGAAFVYPLYCLAQLYRSIHVRQSAAVLVHDPIDAEALVYTSIIFATTPLWLLQLPRVARGSGGLSTIGRSGTSEAP